MRPNREPDFTYNEKYDMYIEEGLCCWDFEGYNEAGYVAIKIENNKILWNTKCSNEDWITPEAWQEPFQNWLMDTIILGV